jgi:hypothetical protein
MVLSSKGSATGSALLTGLPATVRNNNGSYASPSLRYGGGGITLTGYPQAFVNINTTTIVLEQLIAGAATSLTDAAFTNTTSIVISAEFEV